MATKLRIAVAGQPVIEVDARATVRLAVTVEGVDGALEWSVPANELATLALGDMKSELRDAVIRRVRCPGCGEA